MTTKTDKKRVMEKLNKLMAMAERTEGNEHEAAQAAKMVEALLRKHNLTTVGVTPEQAKSDILEGVVDNLKWVANRAPIWVNIVAISVAETYDTYVQYAISKTQDSWVSKPQYNLNYIGAEMDVTISVQMFKYLYNTVNRLCDEHFKVNPISGKGARSIKASYRKGVADRTREKLRAIMIEKEQAYRSTGTGLMVVKKDAIEAYVGKGANYGKGNRTQSKDGQAYAAGYTKGDSVGMNTQLK